MVYFFVVLGTFSSHGCVSGLVQLSCPDGRTINATSAVYGQYIYPHGFACPNDCCPPNPAHDCTELVYDNSPQDWLAIKLLCDGQTDCQFSYIGAGFRASCDVANTPDYIQVFYNCLPRKILSMFHKFVYYEGHAKLVRLRRCTLVSH